MPSPVAAGSGIITTFAGGGDGDGGSATAGILRQPQGLAFDAAGSLYVSDANVASSRVRRISPAGIISAAIGGSSGFFSGDGGPALNASLAAPRGLAIDSSGNVYIADGSNERIRKVNPSGVISTVAGSGTAGLSGDGGAATAASLNSPMGVTTDTSGNLYIADYGNNRVRRVSGSGTITTIAQGVGPVLGVAVDRAGNVFYSDVSLQSERIWKLDTRGVRSVYAGNGMAGYSGDGGPASAASLNEPWGLGFDSNGNLTIADFGNNAVRRVNAATGVITTVAGPGSCTPASPLCGPTAISFDAAGVLYVASTYTVARAGGGGAPTVYAGTVPPFVSNFFCCDGRAATSAGLYGPSGLAASASALYVSDQFNHRIRRVNGSGIISTVAGGSESCQLTTGPLGSGMIQSPRGDGGPATQADLCYPRGLAVDSVGNLYIADSGYQRVRRVDTNGIITTVAGNGLNGDDLRGEAVGDGGPATLASLSSPSGVAVDSSDNLYIADSDDGRIRRVDRQSGRISTVAGIGDVDGQCDERVAGALLGDGGPATAAALGCPTAIAIDGSNNIYLIGLDRVRRVDNQTNVITTVAGNGNLGFSGDGIPATQASLFYPGGLVVRAGSIHIADTGNNRVRKVDAAGVITTEAGNGTSTFAGDAGAATAAGVMSPTSVAADATNNLYIGDGSMRVRSVTL